MTDISVIKMIISVAVWRIYPSWVNDKLRAWEGLGHSGMFWARLSRDDFRSKLEIISFLSRVMSVSKSFFLFPAHLKDLAPNVQALGLLVSTMSWRYFFANSAPSPGIFFLQTPTTTGVFFLNFLSFFFQSRAGVTCLTAMAIPRLSKALWTFGDGTSKTRMISWLPGVGEIERTRTIDSIVVAIGTSRVRRFMVKREKKETQGSQRLIVRRLNPSSSTNQRVLRSLFSRPDVATVSHFAVFVDVDVQLQDGQAGCSAGKAKKGSHPWHFRC